MTAPISSSPLLIAIQGAAGAFHETAARNFFVGKEIEILPCNTFPELFDAVQNGRADYGMAAVENSLAGSIVGNYRLLKESDLNIIGETYLRIEQHLMALPGTSLDTITEIRSHPVAIQQCLQFLKPMQDRGVKVVEAIDTALSARDIKEQQLEGVAAIAGYGAARLYELDIISKNIEDNSGNYTRFLTLAPAAENTPKNNFLTLTQPKVTLRFAVQNDLGTLGDVLKIFSTNNLNVTQLQSVPLEGKPWQYVFFTDLLFTDYKKFYKAIQEARQHTEELEILGVYESNSK